VTLLLRHEDVEDVASPELAVRAVREALRLEAEGRATVPARLNTAAPQGWLRLMPAVVDGANGAPGAMGFKAMNLNRSTGVGYLLLLYEPGTGELQAIMDAAAVTRARTAAVTALAAEALVQDAPTEIGLFGSGYEAESHAVAMKMLWPRLQRIRVYSPRKERREAFARRLAPQLGLDIEAVDDARTAAQAPAVVLATKDTTAVAHADWFDRGTAVLSIGSTRLDLRELDERTFARVDVCLCDSPEQVAAESGDVRAALDGGHLREDQLVRLSDVVARTVALDPPRDLAVFKSVGTALQDLAVGAAVLEACRSAGRGIELGRFPARH
jgi:alanine dehydrogenase